MIPNLVLWDLKMKYDSAYYILGADHLETKKLKKRLDELQEKEVKFVIVEMVLFLLLVLFVTGLIMHASITRVVPCV
jgi:hypothetical protein